MGIYEKAEMWQIVLFPVILIGLLFLAIYLGYLDGIGEFFAIYTILGAIAGIVTLYVSVKLAKR